MTETLGTTVVVMIAILKVGYVVLSVGAVLLNGGTGTAVATSVSLHLRCIIVLVRRLLAPLAITGRQRIHELVRAHVSLLICVHPDTSLAILMNYGC